MKKRLLLTFLFTILFACIYNTSVYANRIEVIYENGTNKTQISEYSNEVANIYYEKENYYLNYSYTSENNLAENIYIYEHNNNIDFDDKKIRVFTISMNSNTIGTEKGVFTIFETEWVNGEKIEKVLDSIEIEVEFTNEEFLIQKSSLWDWNEDKLVVGDNFTIENSFYNGDYIENWGVNERVKVEKIYGNSITINEDNNYQGKYTLTCVGEGTSIIKTDFYNDNEEIIETKYKEYRVSKNNLSTSSDIEFKDNYDLIERLYYENTVNNGNIMTYDNNIILDESNLINKNSKLIATDYDQYEENNIIEYGDFSQRSYKIRKFFNYETYKSGVQTINYYNNITRNNESHNITINEFEITGNLYKNNALNSSNNIELKYDGINLYNKWRKETSIHSENESIASVTEIEDNGGYGIKFKANFISEGETNIIYNISIPFEKYSDTIDESNGLSKYSQEWYMDKYGINAIEFNKTYPIVVNGNYKPEKIIIDRNSIDVYVGMNQYINAEIYPNRGKDAELYWESSNTSVVEVDQNGVLIPKKEGVATVKVSSVTYPEYYQVCTVRVHNDEGKAKANIYNEDNRIMSSQSYNPDTQKYSYFYSTDNLQIIIKDYDLNCNYDVEWTNTDGNNAEIYKYLADSEYTRAEDMCYTFIRLKEENNKDINGILSVIEINSNGEKRIIYNQELHFDSTNRKTYKDYMSINKYNIPNVEVGDSIFREYYMLPGETTILEGECDINNNVVTFTKPGVVKIRKVIKEYSYSGDEEQQEKYYTFDVKNKSKSEEIVYKDKYYIGEILKIKATLNNCNYKDYFSSYQYKAEVPNNSKIYKDFWFGGGGGGGYPPLTYDERKIELTFMSDVNHGENNIYTIKVPLFAGKEKVTLKDESGKIIDTINVEIMNPFIESNIPNSISNNISIYSCIYKGEDNKEYLFTDNNAMTGTNVKKSIEVISGKDYLEVENIEDVEKGKVTANLVPKKSGKAIVKVKYTIDYQDATPEQLGTENMYDKSVNEYYYTKAWYEKKYGIITYEKTYTIDVNYEEPEYLLGDINEDGKINADDAADAIEIFKTNQQTDENIAKGDMDGNGRVTAEDAALIIEYFKTHK